MALNRRHGASILPKVSPMIPRALIMLMCTAVAAGAQEDLSWVSHPNPAIRERGLRDAKRRGLELDVAVVKRLLADSDWGVQLEAIRTFDTNEHEDVRRALASLAINADLLRTRREAAEALSTTDRAAAARALLKWLDRVTGDGKLRAIEALGLIGSPAAGCRSRQPFPQSGSGEGHTGTERGRACRPTFTTRATLQRAA